MNIVIKSYCSNRSLNEVRPCLPRPCAGSAKCCTKLFLFLFKPLLLSKFWFILHIFKHIKHSVLELTFYAHTDQGAQHT